MFNVDDFSFHRLGLAEDTIYGSGDNMTDCDFGAGAGVGIGNTGKHPVGTGGGHGNGTEQNLRFEYDAAGDGNGYGSNDGDNHINANDGANYNTGYHGIYHSLSTVFPVSILNEVIIRGGSFPPQANSERSDDV